MFANHQPQCDAHDIAFRWQLDAAEKKELQLKKQEMQSQKAAKKVK